MAQALPVMLVDQNGNYVGGGGGGGGPSNVNLTAVGGAPYALGPNVAANSQSFVFATDALLNITGSVNASGTMTLGAGSATIGNVGLTAGSASIGTVGLNTGSNIIGQVSINQTTGGTTNAVQLVASGGGNTISGCTRTIISSTTAVVVKATAGNVYGCLIDNNTAGPVYVKLYNAATATVGVGTPRMLFMCSGPTNGGGGNRDFVTPVGVVFNTGICMICTQYQADNDATAVPAGSVTVTVLWV